MDINDTQGGTFASQSTPSQITINASSSPVSLVACTKDGHSNIGWAFNYTGTISTILNGETITAADLIQHKDSNNVITLYAIYNDYILIRYFGHKKRNEQPD